MRLVYLDQLMAHGICIYAFFSSVPLRNEMRNRSRELCGDALGVFVPCVYATYRLIAPSGLNREWSYKRVEQREDLQNMLKHLFVGRGHRNHKCHSKFKFVLQLFSENGVQPFNVPTRDICNHWHNNHSQL